MIIIGIIVLGLLLWLLFKIMKTSIKLAWKLLINAIGGVIGLFLLNILGRFVGFTLEITLFNAIFVGLLGLPGMVLLLLIKYL